MCGKPRHMSTPSSPEVTPFDTPLAQRRLRSRRKSHSVDGSISSACSSPARDAISLRKKISAIRKTIETDNVDVMTLRQLAISRGGLLTDGIRQKAWPSLLSANVTSIEQKPDIELLHGHRDYNQVLMDVNRSLKRFPPGMDEDIRVSMQDQLVDVIMWVLVTHPDLHYYQGYHDIVVTFLLVLGEELTFTVMDKLTGSHLRDFLDQTMDKTNHKLNYLYPLIDKASPKLCAYMEKAELGTVFALSWLITWFGHVLNDIRQIVRLYDFFIACHPLMPIYLAAAVVLYREEAVMACECDMAMIHCVLSRIPDDLPYEALIVKAGDLFIQHPPKSLADAAHSHFIKTKEAQDKNREEVLAAKKMREARMRSQQRKDKSVIVKMSVWTITAVVSAAAFMFINSHTDWRMWMWKN